MSDEKDIPTLFDIVVPGFEHKTTPRVEMPDPVTTLQQELPYLDVLKANLVEQIQSHLETTVRNAVDKAISHAILETTQTIEKNILADLETTIPQLAEMAIEKHLEEHQ